VNVSILSTVGFNGALCEFGNAVFFFGGGGGLRGDPGVPSSPLLLVLPTE